MDESQLDAVQPPRTDGKLGELPRGSRPLRNVVSYAKKDLDDMRIELTAEAEKTLCVAPAGKFRIIHVDPRDHCKTLHGDYDSEGEARDALGTVMSSQREVMQLYNDKGELILL